MAELTPRGMANRRWDGLVAEMEESWTPHWREITEHVMPRRGRWRGDVPNRGDKKNQKIVDATASYSMRVLQAGMMAGLTSPNFPWFSLTAGDTDIERFGPAKRWLAKVEEQMYELFSKSNLYRTLPTVYAEMSNVATSAMYVDPHGRDVINCQQQTIGTYAIGTNDVGEVDTIARRRWRTTGQLVAGFGIDNVSDSVKQAYEQGNLDEWREVRHLVEPNDNRIPDKLDFRGMEYRSLWWEADSDDDKWLRQAGYREFPVMCPRWEVSGENVYGSDCPGMLSLPDIKQLQLMVRRKAEAVEKLVRPPLAIPSNMRGTAISLAPSSLNYVDQFQVQGSISPILQIQPQLGEFRVDINELRIAIQRSYFADLFITIINSQNQPPQKTATEIASIESEKLLMLGPVLDRVFNDLLRPLVNRTFSLMLRFGMIEPPPQEIADRDLRVEFISTLALAQRAVGNVSIERGIGFVGNLAAVQPDVLDVVDFDATVERYFEGLRMPPEVVRPPEERAAIRQQRANVQQAAAAAQIAAPGAQAAKLLSETQVGDRTLLDRVLGQRAA